MNFLDGLYKPGIELGGVDVIFKLLFLVIIAGYVIYSLLLALRVRILNDTVKTPSNSMMALLSYIHLILAVTGSFISVILILVG